MAKNSKKKTQYKFNRGIDSFLLTRDWAIDEAWGLQQLGQYVSEIEKVSEGIVEFKDLKYKQKRDALNGYVFSSSVLKESRGLQRYSLTDDNIPEGSVAHLRLSGVMRMEDGLSSRGIRNLCNEIGLCNSNPNISGIILEINSGGGESIAGHFLNSTVKDSEIPIIVWGHFVGSAAVNGSAPADHIMLASNGAEIGSIGTMVSLDMEYIKWYKNNFKDIYSNKSPGKNKWFREILKGNKKPLIEELNKNVEAFHNNVLEFRTLPKDTKEETLQGGMFIAQDGLDRGLADSIGTFHDAVDQLMNIVNGNSINNNKNFNTMNFQKAYASLIALVNGFFNWELTINSSEQDVKQKFDSVAGSLKDAISSAMSEATDAFQHTIKEVKSNLKKANETIVDLQNELKELKEKNDESSISKEEFEKLKSEFDKMKQDKEKTDKEKADLEKKVAELKGQEGDTSGNSGDAFNNSAKNFIDQVSNISVEGESKY